VVDVLRGWGRDDLVDDGTLVVAELATNAILHARSDFTVGLSHSGKSVRVVVGDASAAGPAPGNPGPDSVAGRGLRIVGAIARSWGHQTVGAGKLVWAELGADSALR
jgi:anti-sigma regulatory factor (Ser/Thr protein kinase)